MPRPASRRASVTATASASLSWDESRGIRPARTAGQQHSIPRTCSMPVTTTAPSTRLATAAAPGNAARGRRAARAAVTSAPPAAPAAQPHPAPVPWSHSAAVTATTQPASAT